MIGVWSNCLLLEWKGKLEWLIFGKVKILTFVMISAKNNLTLVLGRCEGET